MSDCSSVKRCLVCGRNCNNDFKCLTHIRALINDRTFYCRYCCNSFTQKDDPILHQWAHTGVRLYKCDDCGKPFRTGWELKRHQRIHSGVRPYKCDDCIKSFKQSSNLRKPQRIHTGIRPYKCDDCDKSFTTIGIYCDINEFILVSVRTNEMIVTSHLDKVTI